MFTQEELKELYEALDDWLDEFSHLRGRDNENGACYTRREGLQKKIKTLRLE